MWMLRLPDKRTVLCPAKRHSGHCPFDDKTAYINVSCPGRRCFGYCPYGSGAYCMGYSCPAKQSFGYCPYGNNAPCMDVAEPSCRDRRPPRPSYRLWVTNLSSMLVLAMLPMRQHSLSREQCVLMENVQRRGCKQFGCSREQCVPMENVRRGAVCLQ